MSGHFVTYEQLNKPVLSWCAFPCALRRRGETVAVDGFPGISKLSNPLGGRTASLTWYGYTSALGLLNQDNGN